MIDEALSLDTLTDAPTCSRNLWGITEVTKKKVFQNWSQNDSGSDSRSVESGGGQNLSKKNEMMSDEFRAETESISSESSEDDKSDESRERNQCDQIWRNVTTLA